MHRNVDFWRILKTESHFIFTIFEKGTSRFLLMHNSKHSVDIYIMDNCDSAMIVGNMGPLCPAGRSSFSIWSCRTGLAPKIDDCTPPLLMVFCYLPSSNVNVFYFFFLQPMHFGSGRGNNAMTLLLLVKVLNDLHHITHSCCFCCCCCFEFAGHCRRIAIVLSPKWRTKAVLGMGRWRRGRGADGHGAATGGKTKATLQQQQQPPTIYHSNDVNEIDPDLSAPHHPHPHFHLLPSLTTPLYVHSKKLWAKCSLKLHLSN